MFEIGNSLREARLRQGLEFPQIEQATKIRGKYLRALEDEQFDVLPAQTYVKGFLRSYAEYLGLDGTLYVDEYNSRYVKEEEPPLSSRPTTRYRPERMESNAVMLALVSIGVLTALVIAAWRFGGNDDARERGLLGFTQTTKVAKAKKIPSVALQLTATRGNSFLEIHRGSAGGEGVFRGTLERGQTRLFEGRQLWVYVRAPGNLKLRLNGREAFLPGRGAPRTVVVTPNRIRLAPALT